MTDPKVDKTQQRAPTIAGANVLYLVAMVLLITAGVWVQQWSPGWGLVITELVVILLPALIFLRVRHLPVRATLRLRWPGWSVALLSLAIGSGIWFFDIVLNGIVAQLFGYSPGATPEAYTMARLELVGTAIGLALLAPVCEEILFRGLVQRGYERRGPKVAIVVGGLLFALYHLRFQGLIAILPIAAALGYVFWRSQSLVAAILVHFGNNVLGAAVAVLQGLDPAFDVGTIIAVGLGPGILVAALALWLFHRQTRGVARPVPPHDTPGPRWRMVPLIIAVAIYGVFAGLELVYNRFPGIIASDELPLDTAPWTEAGRWSYEMRLMATGETVGEAVCEIVPESTEVMLNCEISQRAFDVQQGRSRYVGGEVTQTVAARWSKETMRLLSAELVARRPDDTSTAEVTREGGSLILATDAGDVETLPDEALLMPQGLSIILIGEGPWRLSALAFEAGVASKATFVEPFRWQPELERTAPLVEEAIVVIEGAEPVTVPAGETIAWRVALGDDRTAWYAESAPHELVQYESGIIRWVLVE